MYLAGKLANVHEHFSRLVQSSQFLGIQRLQLVRIYVHIGLLGFTGVDDLQAALQLNFKPIVAAVVNVNNYQQRAAGKQLPVDQQGGDMGLSILTQ